MRSLYLIVAFDFDVKPTQFTFLGAGETKEEAEKMVRFTEQQLRQGKKAEGKPREMFDIASPHLKTNIENYLYEQGLTRSEVDPIVLMIGKIVFTILIKGYLEEVNE